MQHTHRKSEDKGKPASEEVTGSAARLPEFLVQLGTRPTPFPRRPAPGWPG